MRTHLNYHGPILPARPQTRFPRVGRRSLGLKLFLLVLLLLGLASNGSFASDDLHLNFGLYSSKKPTEMVKQYRPLLTVIEGRLSERLHRPVSIHTQVVKTYEAGIEELVQGRFDFSQVGPVSYVQAKQKNPELQIVAVEGARGGKTVNGIICVLSNSNIRAVADLKGRSFAFGDQFSTTGRYNSQLFLLEQGIKAKDLRKFDYLERHDRVGAAVAAGEYEAGALNERTFKKMNQSGSALRALAQFPISGRPWVARAKLPAEIIEALRQALLETKAEDALSALGEEGLVFQQGDDNDYSSTRTAVERNDRFFQ